MVNGRREKLFLLVGLLALNGFFLWRLYQHGRDFQNRIQWIYAQPVPAAPPAPGPAAGPQVSYDFGDIVRRNPFHPRRNSDLSETSAETAVPPILYGTMTLGENSFALMAASEQAAKRVHVGEEIAGYKLVSIRGSDVVLERGGKTIPLTMAESAPRTPRSPAATPSATPPASAASASPPQPSGTVTTAGPASGAAQTANEEKKKFGPAGYNAPPGAPVNAPAGTVFGGKRKVVNKTPFGDQVWWVDVEKPGQPTTEKEKRPE